MSVSEYVKTNFNFAKFFISKFNIRIIGKTFSTLKNFRFRILWLLVFLKMFWTVWNVRKNKSRSWPVENTLSQTEHCIFEETQFAECIKCYFFIQPYTSTFLKRTRRSSFRISIHLWGVGHVAFIDEKLQVIHQKCNSNMNTKIVIRFIIPLIISKASSWDRVILSCFQDDGLLDSVCFTNKWEARTISLSPRVSPGLSHRLSFVLLLK